MIRKILEKTSGTLAEMISHLLDDSRSISLHLFTASWQKQQFDLIKNELPQDTVVVNMDYSENYATFY